MQMTVEEKKIYEEFFPGQLQAILVADEGEALAQGHDHIADIGNDLSFHYSFVFLLAGNKIEKIFVLEDLQCGWLKASGRVLLKLLGNFPRWENRLDSIRCSSIETDQHWVAASNI